MKKKINDYSFNNVEEFTDYIITFINTVYVNNCLDINEIYPYFDKKSFDKQNKNYTNFEEMTEIQQLFSDISISLFTEVQQKDMGIFFTNDISFVKNVYHDIQIQNIDIINKKILEPAVGSGALILPLIQRNVKIYKEKNINEIISFLNALSKNITCVDINEVCTFATEVLILLELMPLLKILNKNNIKYSLPKLNMITGDYLKISNELGENFDYVIGNPPYVTMYGRRSRGMNEIKRNYFNKSFDFVSNKKGNNKFNLCMFFLELGLKNLKNNGKLSFILDIAFFEAAYIDIRKYILEKTKILSINIKNDIFENVSSGQFILTLQKESSFSKCQSNKITWIDVDGEIIQIQYELYNEKNHYKFSKPLNYDSQKFILSFSNFDTLKNICPNKELRTCCALTGKTEDFIVKNANDDTCQIIPFLEGSKGLQSKFCSLNAEKLIKLDYNLQLRLSNEFKEQLEKQGVKNKKRVTLGNIDAYFFPKIFIRQSAKELIATYTEENYAANNSLYILTFMSNEKSKKDLLKYICALLNSNILSEYALKTGIIRTGKGKTPQIKISDLMRLPLPIDNSNFEVIVDLVEKRLSATCENEKVLLENSLNDIVKKVYTQK